MKKILALIVVLAFAMTVAVGCTKKEEAPAPAAPATQEQTPAAPAAPATPEKAPAGHGK